MLKVKPNGNSRTQQRYRSSYARARIIIGINSWHYVLDSGFVLETFDGQIMSVAGV